jgi:hypothetical protein
MILTPFFFLTLIFDVANVLLQCYFSRRELSTDLLQDQKLVVETAPKLLQAIVDVISTRYCVFFSHDAHILNEE